MSIANLQEKLLFFTRQKSSLSLRVSDIQSQLLTATKQVTSQQANYVQLLQDLYYDENCGYGTDEYSEQLTILQSEHQFEMSQITAWEDQLNLEKDAIDTQLAEITQYESSFQKQLGNSIKNDFSYGSVGGGK